jgi:HD-GYP domain-containing protein (c-di-GMP phosphodiesterase class II)
MSENGPAEDLSLEQEIAYARDLRRIYQAERARRRELEATNRALAATHAELDRWLDDLLAAQEWILAVNSSRELPAVIEALARPLHERLRTQATIVFPWDSATRALGEPLGVHPPHAAPALAALRTSALTAAALTRTVPWEVEDLERAPAPGDPLDYSPIRALGWRAFVAVPLVASEERVGLLYVAWDHPHCPDEHERTLLGLLAQHAAVSLLNARLLAASVAQAASLERAEQQQLAYARDLRQAVAAERARRAELQAAHVATIKVLAAAIEARDPASGNHIERTAALAVATARALGWTDAAALQRLELGAMLHDIGKIGVEDRLLRTPEPLDAAGWVQMRRHPELGARLLQAVPSLRPMVPCVHYHHERYDGRGYPAGLAGDAIPLDARIVAVVDAFDAMTRPHPYGPARTEAEALAEIQRGAGTQFDPTVVAAFLRALAAR